MTEILLCKGGFKTFTSCEGGGGHNFQHETIGLELKGNYHTFQRKLVRFLREHGIENFTVSLVTGYHPDHPGARGLHIWEGGMLCPRRKESKFQKPVGVGSGGYFVS